MSTPDYRRICIATLIVMALGLPVVVYGAVKALESNVNSPSHWVPETFEERQRYEKFAAMFESGDLVIASWPGCTLDDPRLAAFADAFTAPEGESPQPLPELNGFQPQHSYFSRVITGTRLLAELTGPPLTIPRDEAIARLKGTLIGPDGNTTCAVLVFTREGVDNRIKTIAWLTDFLHEVIGIPLDDVHLAGPLVDGASVDRESGRSLSIYGLPSGILILLLGWWSLRSLKVTAIIFALSQYSVAIGLALVYFCGNTMNAVLIVMPPLLLVVGMAGGIHLVNYYYDAVDRGGLNGAPHRAFSLGWVPCTLSTGTTAIGVGSLIVSEMVPIRLFGIYASIAAMTGLALLFLLVPGWLQLSPPPRAVRASKNPNREPELPVQKAQKRVFQEHYGRFVGKYHWLVLSVALVSMFILGWGIQWIETSVKIQALFEEDSKVINDYRWLETNVAPLVTVEVLLHLTADSQLNYLERMELLSDVEESLAGIDEVGGTMSAATFAPPLSTDAGLASAVQRAVLNRKLESRRAEFERVHYLHETDQEQIWRITARVEALNDLDYGVFLNSQVASKVQHALEPWHSEHSGQLSATYTGLMPLVYKSQRALVSDLFSSFLSAFAMVTLVMVVVHRGLLRGVVSMISNLFPTVLMFGALGWIGRPMDIGSVMTASVALGMAVDGTLHFLTFFKRELRHGATRTDAAASAFHHCSGAIVQTFIICGLGLMIFAFSDFVPTAQFAWMMLALMFASVIGNLLVLPCVLVGPLGRVFLPRRGRQATG